MDVKTTAVAIAEIFIALLFIMPLVIIALLDCIVYRSRSPASLVSAMNGRKKGHTVIFQNGDSLRIAGEIMHVK
jgi:hypothetical protein